MLLLLAGVHMQAQSVAEEQMDEFFNDSTLLPYGWFTEGWTVKDGVIQTKASSGFSLDLESLFGNKGTEDPEDTEGTEDPMLPTRSASISPSTSLPDSPVRTR